MPTYTDRFILTAEDRTKAATASAQANFRRLETSVRQVGAALAGGFVIRAAARFTSDTLSMAESIGDVAEKAGLTAEQLQVLRFAAEQNGSSADKLDKAMVKLQASIGLAGREALGLEKSTSPAGVALAKLGVDVLDAGDNIRSSGEVFPEIIDALAAIPNAGDRASRASQIFGKRIGPELAVLINAGSGSLKEFEAQLRATGALFSNEQIEQARQLADQFDAIGFAVKANFQSGFLAGFMGEFGDLKALVNDPEFVASIKEMGEQFGKALKAVVDAAPPALAALQTLADHAGTIVRTLGVIGGARFGASLTRGLPLPVQAAAAVIGGVGGGVATDAALGGLAADDPAIARQEARTRAAIKQTRDLTAAAQQRLTAETATSNRLVDLKDEETKRLTAALERQKDAYREATQAVADALREREQVEQDIADFDARGRAAKAPTLLTAVNASNRARASLGAGDTKEALRQAREALDLIGQLRDAGGNDATAKLLGDKVKATLRAAANAQTAQAEQLQTQYEKAQALFEGLLDQVKAFENIKAEFDDASAVASAKALRTAIEQALSATPIVIPVTVATPDLTGTQTTVPGRAHGGPIPGYSPHARADNILMWGTAKEWVIQQPSALYYGDALMDALNRRVIPREAIAAALAPAKRYALGGPIAPAGTDRLVERSYVERITQALNPPGYAFGGQIVASLQADLPPRPQMPTATAAPAAPTTTINLTLPGGQTYTVRADTDTATALQNDIGRQALKHGRP